MKLMRKTISIIMAALIIAAGLFPAAAQKKSKGKQPEKRDITIYVYALPSENTDFQWRLVPVRRKIVDYKPLGAAIKELLKGATAEEQKRNLIGFPDVLKFYSARIRNKTAQINLKFADPQNLVEESWEGSGFKHEDFVKAVEQTAKQLPGVERVSICVGGIKNYADFGAQKRVKCPFPMFR